MESINLAVIGDIHYPSSRTAIAIDEKLKAPPGVTSKLGTPRLSLLLDNLAKTHNQNQFDAILFVGDFTTAGKIPDFKDALLFFSKALASLQVPLIGVPGNHDLKRPKSFVDNEDKFKEFAAELGNPEIKISVSYELFRELQPWSRPGVSLFALNSCASCNELWQSDGKQALAQYLAGAALDIPEHQLYEYFDAPFLDVTSITAILDGIEYRDVRLPIVLAHHNLLSQKIPRVAIFPEMLNSGYARQAFASVGPPVIYLHGHIHDDPVDVLANPENHSQVGLVTISAPLATDGYTHLRVLVAKDGTPLAINVQQKRMDKVSFVSPKSVSIPFYERSQLMQLMPSDASKLIGKLKKAKAEPYDRCVADYGVDLLRNLEIAGLIVVTRNLLAVTSTWRVRCSGE